MLFTFIRRFSNNSSNALMESVNLAGLGEEFHQVNKTKWMSCCFSLVVGKHGPEIRQ